jgi:7,8-dihydropterin-6-yl-methyl-4-(beta-D-ribofuranosyl)aminobenzene 5'-phosphate synthase
MSWRMNNRLVRVIIAVTLVLTLSAGCARSGPTATPGATPTLVVIAPTVTPKTAATPFTPPAPVETLGDVRITIVYDNVEHDARLKTNWGFAALVEYGGQTLLFDTGADAPTLLGNIKALGIDLTRIQYVALSHIHDDHVGGLSGLLATGARPTVYVPPSFPSDFKRQVEASTRLVAVMPGQEIGQGVFTSGEISGNPPEQALVLRTGGGLVIVTGCAHPGIVKMVTQIKERFNEPIRLVLGGLHLEGKNDAQLSSILDDFRRLGVMQAAPTHCTGQSAMTKFAAQYGDDFIQGGVGRVIVVKAR